MLTEKEDSQQNSTESDTAAESSPRLVMDSMLYGFLLRLPAQWLGLGLLGCEYAFQKASAEPVGCRKAALGRRKINQ